ncbi:hypothetical protein VTO42DRAFT_8891 [Malbranchea cinnamomea]
MFYGRSRPQRFGSTQNTSSAAIDSSSQQAKPHLRPPGACNESTFKACLKTRTPRSWSQARVLKTVNNEPMTVELRSPGRRLLAEIP